MAKNPMKVEGIDHIVLKVTDIERSLEFYVQVLGLRLERVIEDLGIYQVRAGKNIIDLLALSAGKVLAEKDQRGLDHVCLMIDGDIDDIVSYLKEKKIEFASPVRELYGATGFGTSMYIVDPDGHMIELKVPYCQYAVKTTVIEALKGLRPR
ncbi:MAG TPA: VOC family protein [Stellaceae bacterium]|nr:VOC family protein [Stellaceae bacterium]